MKPETTIAEPFPTVSGRVLIIGIVSLGILASVFAWWHQQQQGQRTLDYWGSDVAFQLRYAQEVELLQLAADTGESDDYLEIDGAPWPIAARRSIGTSRGIVHARQALVFDPSYDWITPPATSPHWQYALRFRAESNGPPNSSVGNDDAVILFDLEQSVVRNLAHQNPLKIDIAAGLQLFFDEKLSE